jgi:copper(I)-binding protein
MRFLHLAAACLALAIAAVPAISHEYKAGALTIHHPWTKATPPGAKVAGGYVQFINAGTEDDKLIGGTFAEAERVEIHEMKMDGDVMKMAEVAGGLPIPAGQTVELKPGGYHIMLMGLKRTLKEGEAIAGTLQFERAGTVSVEFKVEAMGGPQDGHKHDGATTN